MTNAAFCGDCCVEVIRVLRLFDGIDVRDLSDFGQVLTTYKRIVAGGRQLRRLCSVTFRCGRSTELCGIVFPRLCAGNDSGRVKWRPRSPIHSALSL